MSVKKLGFGMMRLPLLNKDDDGSIDIELTKKMVDVFIERGFTYFDTAWMYCDYKSENAVKAAVVDRHPRDSFTLTTKLHNMYVHINVDWDHGPFRYVIASPRMHQWHHADLPRAYGKNLANIFPVFDLVFGTYYVPGPCKEAFGVQGAPENDVVQLTLFPFAEWGRMVLRAVGQQKRAEKPAEDSEHARTEKHRATEPDASAISS